MPEQAHFKYEANPRNLIRPSGDTPEIEIEDISFLMPIRITCKINGQPQIISGGMNYATKEMVLNDTHIIPAELAESMKEKVFEFLKIATTLPEESYQASDEVYEQAARANEEYEEISKQNVGGL